MKKERGFTLIELLVVIAIIGLLATIVMVNLNSARVKVRNVKRNSDNKQLMTAFTMAADAAGGVFPSTGGDVWSCVSASCGGSWAGFLANDGVDLATAQYIKKPEDPANSSRGMAGYVYNGAWGGGANYLGVIHPAGAYLSYTLEPVTVTPGTCGVGSVWSSSASYIQCMIKLN